MRHMTITDGTQRNGVHLAADHVGSLTLRAAAALTILVLLCVVAVFMSTAAPGTLKSDNARATDTIAPVAPAHNRFE